MSKRHHLMRVDLVSRLRGVAVELYQLAITIEQDVGKTLTHRYRDETLVSQLELSIRTANCLKNDLIETCGRLYEMSDAELLRIPNLGKKSLHEIRELLYVYDVDEGE